MRQKIFIAGSALISLVVNLFGGWDTALETLILFMGIDWFTGGVYCRLYLKRARNQKAGHWKAEQGGKDYAEKGWCCYLY